MSFVNECHGDGDQVWLCQLWRAWCVGGTWTFGSAITGTYLALACPPKLSNEGMEKQTIGGTTLAAFGAPLRLLIISSHSTSKAIWLLCGGGVCIRSIIFILNQGQLAYTSGVKLVSIRCSGVESQMYRDGGKHINQVHGNSQAIAHGCASILHYPGHNCPDAVMQCLNDIFALCEEVIQLGFIFQGCDEKGGVHLQPCLTCLFAQVVNCFIEIFNLLFFGVHNGVVGHDTVRASTGNLLITSGLSTHAEQHLLTGQVDKVVRDLPPQLLCLAGQKEDLLCLLHR